MDREEKVRFILEQMRLCLAKKDFIRTQIISKKISTKFFFSDTDVVQVRVVIWGMMIGAQLVIHTTLNVAT